MSQVGGEISAEILEACRRGDREAFRLLYEAYKDRVYSIAFYFFRRDPAAARCARPEACRRGTSARPARHPEAGGRDR